MRSLIFGYRCATSGQEDSGIESANSNRFKVNQKKVFYGWYVIIALSIVGLAASAVRYTFSVFAPSLLQEFGWTRTTMGFAFTLHFWISCIIAPLVGLGLDKLGGRFILVIGSIFLLVSMILLSTLASVWQLHIYYGVLAGIGLGCTFLAPISSIARKWFVRKAGVATSIVLTGSGLGLSIAPPIVSLLIGEFGWRAAYNIFGIPVALLCILVAGFVIRNSPESMGLLPDGAKNTTSYTGALESPVECNALLIDEKDWEVREAIGTANFWLINLAYGLCPLGVIAIITHMVTWAHDFQIDRESAALALFMLGICSVLSRIVGGVLCDRFGAKLPIYISAIALAIVNLYALKVSDKTSLYIFSLAMGLFYGLQLPCWAPLLGDLFGRKSIGTLMGIMSFSFGCISGPGPTIFGWIFDRYRSYNMAFLLMTVCFLIAYLFVLMIRPRTKGLLRSEEVS